MTPEFGSERPADDYEYYPDSQRLYRVTRPDGGYTIMEYGDQLYADPDQSASAQVGPKTTTLIEGTNIAEEWKYMDGSGSGAAYLRRPDHAGTRHQRCRIRRDGTVGSQQQSLLFTVGWPKGRRD